MKRFVNVYQFNYKEIKKGDFEILFGEVDQDRIDRLYKKAFSYTLKNKYKNMKNEQIAEEIFFLFNKDNRPNEKIQRSISVGDIVEVNGKVYVCCSFGFEEKNLDLSKIQNEYNYNIY